MASNKKIKNIVETCEVIDKPIKNFLNNELKSFAYYTLRSRTMPNIMDGLRIGARKIIYAAMTGDLSKRKFVKMPSLIGDTMKLQYAHGDASLASTIVNLCCKHLNKYAPLEAIGQIPSLRVPKCDTAVRYLMIKKSEYLDFFTYDKELLEIQEEEGEAIEPKYFLPIVPFVLLNRTSSPGFGFSFKAFSYNLDDIIDNIIMVLERGTCVHVEDSIPLTPVIEGIKQENIIYNSNKNKWYNVGEYEFDNDSDVMFVNDLPFNVSYENFEEKLNQLKESLKIKDWSNVSEGGNIRYIVKFQQGTMKNMYESNKWNFFKMFNLYTPIPSDILSCIDEDGKHILFFDGPHELIDSFVEKRLKYYEARKLRTIKILREKIAVYKAKKKFIELVISGELVVLKRKLADIKADLKKYNIPDYVLDMKFYNLTAEEITKLENLLDQTVKTLDYIQRTSIKEMYLHDLIDFKEKYGTKIIEKNIA